MSDTTTESLPAGVQRVTEALAAQGHPHAPLMLDDAARTAQQAADALGVALGQIAKSIIFRRKNHPSGDDAAVLVITSGDLRVDEKKVQAIVCAEGGKLGRADAEFVKAKTGFTIGGVSPVAHTTSPVTVIDRDGLTVDITQLSRPWDAAVVEDVFEILDEREPTGHVVAVFDPATGAPTELWLDPYPTAIDDEEQYTLTVERL